MITNDLLENTGASNKKNILCKGQRLRKLNQVSRNSIAVSVRRSGTCPRECDGFFFLMPEILNYTLGFKYSLSPETLVCKHLPVRANIHSSPVIPRSFPRRSESCQGLKVSALY